MKKAILKFGDMLGSMQINEVAPTIKIDVPPALKARFFSEGSRKPQPFLQLVFIYKGQMDANTYYYECDGYEEL